MTKHRRRTRKAPQKARKAREACEVRKAHEACTGNDKRRELTVADAAQQLRGLTCFSLRTFVAMLKRNWHCFVAFFLASCILLSLGFYAREQLTATTVMSLNYEDGAKGRNPNGTRFNVSDLRSQEVVGAAIEAAGLVGELDAQELAACISITPSVQRSAGDGSYYISTSYQVSLTLPQAYSRLITAKDMLGLVCRAFRSSFYQKHVITAKALPTQLESFDEMEYSQIGEYIDLIATRAQSYLDMRLNGTGSFTAKSGETFASLKQHLNNLVEYDLAIYNALVWERGIAKNREQEISVLSELNHSLDITYRQYIMESDMYQQIMAEYNNNMTASVLIPTYDQNREYYMARTQTGVDELSKAAFDKRALAAAVQSKIGLNQNRIQKLGIATAQSWYNRADSLAASLLERLEGVLAQIRALDEEYIDTSTRNAVTFTQSERSATDVLHLKDVLALSLVGCLLLYCIFVKLDRHRLKKWMKRFEANGRTEKEG